MRILADQDVYKMTTDKLTEWGHDVITARSLDMQKAPDEEILRAAKKARRLLITRDKDFGELLFLKEKDTAGVILLRAGSRIWKKSIVNCNGSFVSRKKMFSGTRLP